MEPTTIAETLAAAELPVPAGVHYACSVFAAADAYANGSPGAAERALAEEVEQGLADPTELPDRWRLISTERNLGNDRYTVVQSSRVAAAAHARSAVVAKADEFLDALRPRFDAAAVKLAATVEPLERLGLRQDGQRTHESADTPERAAALAELRIVRDVRVVLARCGYGTTRGETGSWWTRPEKRADLLAANSCCIPDVLAAHGTPFVPLVERGLTLHLNDAATAARVDALTAKKPPADLLARR